MTPEDNGRICKQYEYLSPLERYQLIGKTVHLLQNSTAHFVIFSQLVGMAESLGMLDNVVIMPAQTEAMYEKAKQVLS